MNNRCLQILVVFISSTFLLCCKKDSASSPLPIFKTYTIFKGKNYADGFDSTHIVFIKTNDLKFIAKFDSSAIYSTFISSNQIDVNKLYGFSDNNSDHHLFSARMGWAWYNNTLNLFGYTYNNGVRSILNLGVYSIGTNLNCRIQTDTATKSYYFTVNGKTKSMPRAAKTSAGSGYRLYPYFGGDEPAPHTVTIQISE